jgi:hypothetical protein
MHSAAESPRVFGDLSHGSADVNGLLIGIWRVRRLSGF